MTATGRLSSHAYGMGDTSDLSDSFGHIPDSTPAQVRSAQVTIAEHARDATDAAILLWMLGIGERIR